MPHKKQKIAQFEARVVQLINEWHRLAYTYVDADLRIAQISPNFPSELTDADLTRPGISLGEAFGEFVGMEDVLHDILRGERSLFQIERVNRIQADGSIRYLSFRVVPLDVQKPSAGLLVIVEDVTSSGLIEHSLVQNRNELRFVQDALAHANADLDKRVEQRTAELAEAKQQIEKQLVRMQALRLNDLAILGTTDLRVALKTIADQTRKHLRMDVVSVLLFNPYSLRFENAVVAGAQTSEIQSAWIRMGETVIGRAAFERQTLIFPDVSQEPQLELVGKSEGFLSCFALPLIAKGKIVGVMYLGHRSIFQPNQDWLDFLESLAGQAAMAIESIKAFEDLQRSNFELALAYSRTIEGWSRALDLRDMQTKDHTSRVTELTLKLAHLVGMNEIEIMHVKHGALLHDIGKMGIPDAILLKDDYLSDEEWEIMRRHPAYAYEMLSPVEYLRPALDIPYCHHEKWDGTGYPRGLAGEQIPLAARLFAVVDVWDALRSNRPYRKGWNEDQVREYIRSQSGTHFDPYAVDLFLRLLDEMDKEQMDQRAV
ncbi:MAG: HD domain-containing protein [Anaerolineales bacterium]|nr:HD domain-containing protein [Anaerolineales bacterium]